jgi:hypothetical protein
MKCLGHLPRNDPLYEYLRHDILPQIGVFGVNFGMAGDALINTGDAQS